MFTPLKETAQSVFPTVRIDRLTDGWQVHGAHPRKFSDSDYEGSPNNTYVAAVTYSEMMVRNSKRAWSLNRNFVLVEKKDRQKVFRLYVRITRPTGGYKFFLVTPTGPAGIDRVQLNDIRLAVIEAVSWFIKEREKCEDTILSKNIAVKKARKNKRHNLLFGGFIPGQG